MKGARDPHFLAGTFQPGNKSQRISRIAHPGLAACITITLFVVGRPANEGHRSSSAASDHRRHARRTAHLHSCTPWGT